MVVVAEAVQEVFDELNDRYSNELDPSEELHGGENLKQVLGGVAAMLYQNGDFMRQVFTALAAESMTDQPLEMLLMQLVNGYINTEELKAELWGKLEGVVRRVMDDLSEESEESEEGEKESEEGEEESEKGGEEVKEGEKQDNEGGQEGEEGGASETADDEDENTA